MRACVCVCMCVIQLHVLLCSLSRSYVQSFLYLSLYTYISFTFTSGKCDISALLTLYLYASCLVLISAAFPFSCTTFFHLLFTRTHPRLPLTHAANTSRTPTQRAGVVCLSPYRSLLIIIIELKTSLTCRTRVFWLLIHIIITGRGEWSSVPRPADVGLTCLVVFPSLSLLISIPCAWWFVMVMPYFPHVPARHCSEIIIILGLKRAKIGDSREKLLVVRRERGI